MGVGRDDPLSVPGAVGARATHEPCVPGREEAGAGGSWAGEGWVEARWLVSNPSATPPLGSLLQAEAAGNVEVVTLLQSLQGGAGAPAPEPVSPPRQGQPLPAVWPDPSVGQSLSCGWAPTVSGEANMLVGDGSSQGGLPGGGATSDLLDSVVNCPLTHLPQPWRARPWPSRSSRPNGAQVPLLRVLPALTHLPQGPPDRVPPCLPGSAGQAPADSPPTLPPRPLEDA